MPDAQPPLPPDLQPARDVLDRVGDAVAAVDEQWRLRYLNRRAARILGRPPADLIGRVAWDELAPAASEAFRAMCEQAMTTGRPLSQEGHYRPLDRWIEVRVHPMDGGALVFVSDVTARKAAEEELRRSEQRYRVLTHALNSVVWRTDAAGVPTHDADWRTLLGYVTDGDQDVDWRRAIHPEDRHRIRDAWVAALEAGHVFDEIGRLRHRDGGWRHVRCRGVPVATDGVVEEWVGVIYDLTEQVQAEDVLRRAMYEDPLTGIANRTLFIDRLTEVMRERDPCAAVLYIDIDRFKSINDRFGHAAGDDLLRAVARRVREVVRPSDVVSRLSGDEFAVLCDHLSDEEEAAVIGARVVAAIGQPLEEDERLQSSASLGVAFVAPHADDDPEEVMRAADAAMYQVKSRGGAGVEVFEEELRSRLRRRTVIEGELRGGLPFGGLHLHYQPIVPFAAGRRPRVEALLRWQRTGGPLIPASDAVSVAEQTGLIGAIGRDVLAAACEQAAAWVTDGLDLGVAVNVSPLQLAQPDTLLGDVRDALRVAGLPPDRLTLEITENVLMEDMAQGEEVLGRLRELGVALEIDDFGVGYSSLSYLHRLPVQAVKLDRSFIRGLPEDQASARVLEAVVGLARAFAIDVVAEGVETRAQHDAVRAAGCHAVQGFLLAPPVAPDELPDRLAAARAASAAG